MKKNKGSMVVIPEDVLHKQCWPLSASFLFLKLKQDQSVPFFSLPGSSL